MKENIEIKKEIKEKEPKIHYDFLFLAHTTAKDAEIIREKLEKADIYCPEIFGWASENEEFLKKLTQGEISEDLIKRQAEGMNFPEFCKRLFEILKGSRKKIVLVDLPVDLEFSLIKDSMQLEFNIEECIKNFLYGSNIDVKKKVNEMRNLLEKYSQTEKEREEKIIDFIKNKIRESIKSPEFRNKEEINVLISFGASHTFLYHYFKKTKNNVSWKFPSSVFVFDRFTELLRKKKFFPKKEISDSEIIDMFIEEFLRLYLNKFSNNYSDTAIVVNYILKKKKPSLEQMERFKNIFEGLTVYYFDILPRDRKEFDNLLKKLKKKYGHNLLK